MSYGFVRMPLWAVGLCAGAFWTLVMLVLPLTSRPDGLNAPVVLIYVVAGALFGTFIALTTRRQRRKLFSTGGRQLTGREREAVVRAVYRGEPLTDATLRTVAHRYAERLHGAPRRRWPVAVMYAALTGLAVWLAVDSSPGWWAVVVAWPMVLAAMIYLDNRQRAAVDRYLDRVKVDGDTETPDVARAEHTDVR